MKTNTTSESTQVQVFNPRDAQRSVKPGPHGVDRCSTCGRATNDGGSLCGNVFCPGNN